MSSNNRVLVVIDPESDDQQTSLQRGEWLAQTLGLGLDLLLCDYEQYLSGDRVVDSPGLAELRKNAIDANRERLERMAEPARAKGLDVVVSAVWDNPLDEGIARHVIRTEPAYVVKETHYHSQIGRALFAHTDWNLVRYCPCPLWLAKPHDWPEKPSILAGIDPMHVDDKHADLDVQILDQSSALAKGAEGKLHVFHAFFSVDHIAAGPIEAGGIIDAGLSTSIEKAHKDSVDNLLKGYAVADDRRHVLAGHPQSLYGWKFMVCAEDMEVYAWFAWNHKGRTNHNLPSVSAVPCGSGCDGRRGGRTGSRAIR